jgi:hypothetical protein
MYFEDATIITKCGCEFYVGIRPYCEYCKEEEEETQEQEVCGV